jgi:diacylglycerol kinase family enzyme
LVGNGRYYGGPFPVFPHAKIDDGLLDVLVFRNQGHFDIVRYMHGVIFGTHPDFHDVDYLVAREVRVTSDEEVPAEVDGELIGNVPITFRFSPHKLRVLAPGRRIKSFSYGASLRDR